MRRLRTQGDDEPGLLQTGLLASEAAPSIMQIPKGSQAGQDNEEDPRGQSHRQACNIHPSTPSLAIVRIAFPEALLGFALCEVRCPGRWPIPYRLRAGKDGPSYCVDSQMTNAAAELGGQDSLPALWPGLGALPLFFNEGPLGQSSQLCKGVGKRGGEERRGAPPGLLGPSRLLARGRGY